MEPPGVTVWRPKNVPVAFFQGDKSRVDKGCKILITEQLLPPPFLRGTNFLTVECTERVGSFYIVYLVYYYYDDDDYYYYLFLVYLYLYVYI